MVAVQIRYGETFYVIGEFWEIVERLKAHRAYFRFRARRWRWPETRAALELTMQPFEVLDVTFSQAQALQLQYDLAHITPTQAWLKVQRGLAEASVEWWQTTKLKDAANSRQLKQFETHRDRLATALDALDLPAADLTRDQIVAMQQTRRLLEKYEPRLLKWLGDRAKIRRREALLDRFERELGLTRANLLEIETAGSAARQALYEEVAGLEWQPAEISELKAAARLLATQARQAARRHPAPTTTR